MGKQIFELYARTLPHLRQHPGNACGIAPAKNEQRFYQKRDGNTAYIIPKLPELEGAFSGECVQAILPKNQGK